MHASVTCKLILILNFYHLVMRKSAVSFEALKALMKFKCNIYLINAFNDNFLSCKKLCFQLKIASAKIIVIFFKLLAYIYFFKKHIVLSYF